jgi:hypothetical protein
VTRTRWPLLALALWGCSDLQGLKGGVVAIELRLPNPAVVEPGDTLALRARALNEKGDSVAATFVWLTPDNTLTLDPAGLVTTSLTTGTGRVQASVGSLRSDLVTLAIRRASDTLALAGPDTLTVAPGDSASGALEAAVLSLTPDTVGISGTSILYEVVDAAAAQDNQWFAGKVLALRATTSIPGTPATPVTLRRGDPTRPDTVDVRVSAARPSGKPVPGSGQLFTVIFQ